MLLRLMSMKYVKDHAKILGFEKRGAKFLQTFVGGNLLMCKPILKDKQRFKTIEMLIL